MKEEAKNKKCGELKNQKDKCCENDAWIRRTSKSMKKCKEPMKETNHE